MYVQTGNYLDTDDPWAGILAATAFAMEHVSYYTQSHTRTAGVWPRLNI